MTLTLTDREKRRGWLYLILQMFLVPNGCALLCIALGIWSDAVINAAAFFTNAALALLFFRNLLRQSRKNARWGRTVLTALKGFGLYWLLSTLTTTLILSIRPDFANINDAGVNAMIDEYPLMMALAVVFAAPLAEECLFRGWIFTGLAEKNVPLAYIVTCGLFSIAHVVGYIGSYEPQTLVLCLLQYIGPSFALCWTCRKNDSLIAPLLLHMTVNALSCALLPLMGG